MILPSFSRVACSTMLAAAAFVSVVPNVHAQAPLPFASQMDPQMATVLEYYQAAAGTPIYQLNAADARQQFSAEDAANAVARSSGKQLAPRPLGSVVDMYIPGASGTQIPVRVYTPVGKGPFPVVLYFHGGGFVVATNDTYDASPRALAAGASAIVISVEYRKAPEHPFPAALEDAVAAYTWTIQNAASVNGIQAKVAVAGESAGGNLAANLAILAHQLGVQAPVRQVLVYPLVDSSTSYASDATYATAIPLGLPGLKYFGGLYVPAGVDPENPLVSPIKANLSGVAPATIIAAEIDPLQSQGKQFATDLQNAGVAVNYQLYTGVTHEFFGMGAVVDKAQAAEQVVINDLLSSF